MQSSEGFIHSLVTGKLEPTNDSQRRWLIGQLVRASHRYRKVAGSSPFEVLAVPSKQNFCKGSIQYILRSSPAVSSSSSITFLKFQICFLIFQWSVKFSSSKLSAFDCVLQSYLLVAFWLLSF